MMLIRLEPSFIETASKLNSEFSAADKQTLAANIELKYDEIISVVKDLENKKEKLNPKIIELENISSRSFSLHLYYSWESENDDVPISITQLLPTVSPVRVDIMTKLQQQQQSQPPQSNDVSPSYLKAGQVYDDGDTHSRFINEIIEEDEGRRPIT
jgi:glycyl-tRNA synthetase (class II)